MSLDIRLFHKRWVYDENKILVEIKNDYVYDDNITHNLTDMASAVGVYEAMWRPYRLAPNYPEQGFDNYQKEMEFEDSVIIRASDIVEILKNGLEALKRYPDTYKKLNPENGWGSYEGLVACIDRYIYACEKDTNAIVEVSR